MVSHQLQARCRGAGFMSPGGGAVTGSGLFARHGRNCLFPTGDLQCRLLVIGTWAMLGAQEAAPDPSESGKGAIGRAQKPQQVWIQLLLLP